jgi:uncharacterized protein
MLAKPGVIDANVLVYAVNTDAPQHTDSRLLLEVALDPAAALYVTPQILCEFYSVITNSKRTAAAFTATQALQIISDLLELPGLQVLGTSAAAAHNLVQLLKRRPVTGAGVFDLQIVATMLANDVQRIYTFNVADFAAFSELTVSTP